MTKIRTQDLTGPALRWAVATLDGYTNLRLGAFSGVLVMDPPRKEFGAVEFSSLCYDTDWSQGGPIIERESIAIIPMLNGWEAQFEPSDERFSEDHLHLQTGPTPLIAAMRCFVASRLGDEVEVPEELLQ